jgi:FtsH-binding integral membrane protein
MGQASADQDKTISVIRSRFRIFRWLLLVVYSLLALFFGMLLNLRPFGWIGTTAALALTVWLSRRLSTRGCLLSGLIWLAGLVAILILFRVDRTAVAQTNSPPLVAVRRCGFDIRAFRCYII